VLARKREALPWVKIDKEYGKKLMVESRALRVKKAKKGGPNAENQNRKP
jgi:hypothetical protein